MKIYISKIPKSGLDSHEIYEPKDLDIETEDIRFKVPIEVFARVVKDNNNVEIDGTVKWLMLLTCSRCLISYESQVSKNIRLYYKVKDENFLDITDEIRQEIILSYPTKPLCIKDCRGLCQTCGKNLNEGDCCCGSTEKTSF